MPCTTILVGKKASYDGSTMMARNDDSGAGGYTPKKFTVVKPKEQPRKYKSVISNAKIDLPDDPMQYTCVPNAVEGEGIWAASGINAAGVAMTATETITSNERVQGLDPCLDASVKKGGIGEEDLVVLTLPYIKSAREGVVRLGSLLEKYGTYEMNGIGFADKDEVWWLETIGGHHWIARRVPDEAYVVMPNQMGIDMFDLDDALGAQKEHMCSSDMREFIEKGHLDLSISEGFNARYAFGSHEDADHVYNTPRAWYMERYLNPHTYYWDGPTADYRPDSNDIPWSLIPEKKITEEDVKYLLSSHFQGTPYDPYASYGDPSMRGAFRSIGVNRTDFMSLLQIRPDAPAIQWVAFGSNVFNVMVPMYVNINEVPKFLGTCDADVSTDSFYWNSRLIGALANASYKTSLNLIERYQLKVHGKCHEIINRYDEELKNAKAGAAVKISEKANNETAKMVQEETRKVLNQVLKEASNVMKNSYARSDA